MTHILTPRKDLQCLVAFVLTMLDRLKCIGQLLMMRVSSDESENPGQQMQYSRTCIFISHTHTHTKSCNPYKFPVLQMTKMIQLNGRPHNETHHVHTIHHSIVVHSLRFKPAPRQVGHQVPISTPPRHHLPSRAQVSIGCDDHRWIRNSTPWSSARNRLALIPLTVDS